MLLNELGSRATLVHPHILNFEGVVSKDGVVYLTTPEPGSDNLEAYCRPNAEVDRVRLVSYNLSIFAIDAHDSRNSALDKRDCGRSAIPTC